MSVCFQDLSTAFNLGNHVITKKHIDPENCPFGWCTITALGDFDASKGGHIILWILVMGIIPKQIPLSVPEVLFPHI